MLASLIILLLLVPFVTPSALSATFSVGTYTRYTQFINDLTLVQPDGSVTILSAGGAAGGIISEGQGYGILIASVTAIAIGPSDPNYQSVITMAYNLWRGWQRMCIGSLSGNSCQTNYYCTPGNGTYYPCLPHWKFNSQLGNWEYGSATDGDEDAILGMILLVAQTANNKPSWWTQVANWAFDSIRQFYDYDTILALSTDSVLRLGSCWGGMDCNNPSYHSPGSYRAFRNYLTNYGPTLGRSSSQISTYVANLNNLITISYEIILADQNQYGLTTNWYVPGQSNVAVQGTTGCSGSGTPAGEFGTEAGRGVWRIALDWLWFPSEATSSVTYLTPIVKQLDSIYTGSSFGNLETGGLVTSIFSSWLSNPFIFGPTFTSLIMPVSSVTNQQTILNTAASILNSATNTDYYDLSWIVISTFTLSGDLAKAATYVSSGSSSPPPTTPPPTTPPPTTPPPTTPPASSLKCGVAGCAINNWWVEFVPPSGVTVSSAQVQCSSGTVISCTLASPKYQCSSPGSVCSSPVPLVNGQSCPLTLGTASQTCSGAGMTIAPYLVDYVPPSGYSINLATVQCDGGSSYYPCVVNGSFVSCAIQTNPCNSPLPIYNGSPCTWSGVTNDAQDSLASDPSNSMLSTGELVGIVIAALVIIGIIIAAVVYVRAKRRATMPPESF